MPRARVFRSPLPPPSITPAALQLLRTVVFFALSIRAPSSSKHQRRATTRPPPGHTNRRLGAGTPSALGASIPKGAVRRHGVATQGASWLYRLFVVRPVGRQRSLREARACQVPIPEMRGAPGSSTASRAAGGRTDTSGTGARPLEGGAGWWTLGDTSLVAQTRTRRRFPLRRLSCMFHFPGGGPESAVP
jgi:hypothetical protein